MAYKLTVKDASGEFLREFHSATPVALIAAAQVIINAVKRRLAGGYTSGAFTTGNVLNSVTRSDPEPTGLGGYALEIGTNVPYALYWELGHHNVFTRKYERAPVWEPAFLESQGDAASTYERVLRRLLRQPQESVIVRGG